MVGACTYVYAKCTVTDNNSLKYVHTRRTRHTTWTPDTGQGAALEKWYLREGRRRRGYCTGKTIALAVQKVDRPSSRALPRRRRVPRAGQVEQTFASYVTAKHEEKVRKRTAHCCSPATQESNVCTCTSCRLHALQGAFDAWFILAQRPFVHRQHDENQTNQASR